MVSTTPRVHLQPWPVDPYAFPLDGPTQGQVYCPPLTPRDRAYWTELAATVAIHAIHATLAVCAVAYALILGPLLRLTMRYFKGNSYGR